VKIEILTVKATTNPGKREGTSYQALDVAFKNLSFGNKVEGRKIMSFGPSGSSFKVLSNARAGDVYEIVVEKIDGYNTWIEAKKSDGSAVDSSPPATAQRTTATAGTTSGNASPKSTYETPEERAKKQVYIVRQSSVGSAIEVLSVGAKTSPDVDKVIELAKVFENYVFGDTTAKVDSPSSFDDLEDVPL
jgi:hypothetical protein